MARECVKALGWRVGSGPAGAAWGHPERRGESERVGLTGQQLGQSPVPGAAGERGPALPGLPGPEGQPRGAVSVGDLPGLCTGGWELPTLPCSLLHGLWGSELWPGGRCGQGREGARCPPQHTHTCTVFLGATVPAGGGFDGYIGQGTVITAQT